jgi:ATP/maltotriose-dependent transcriptional regulator MalT
VGAVPDRVRLRTPRLPQGVVARPRLAATVARAHRYPVTLVEAPAGYGKTTFAVTMTARGPVSWYGLTPADLDLQVFLVHLLAALEPLCPPVAAAPRLLDQPGRASAAWPDAVDAAVEALEPHLSARATGVLDDYHVVDCPEIGAVLSRLVESAPPVLGIIITSRERPHLESMMRWRGQGRVLLIDRAELAFTSDELGAFLASRFGVGLTPPQCDFLTQETEGWPVAIELIGQRLVGTGESREAQVTQLPEGRERIFEYLTNEVLARQGPEERWFLEQLASVRDFDLDDCYFMTVSRTAANASTMSPAPGSSARATGADATASITCCAKRCSGRSLRPGGPPTNVWPPGCTGIEAGSNMPSPTPSKPESTRRPRPTSSRSPPSPSSPAATSPFSAGCRRSRRPSASATHACGSAPAAPTG